MLNTTVPILKHLIPQEAWQFLYLLYNYLRSIFNYWYYNFIQWKYKKIVQKIKKKDKIKVAFFLIHESVWKYDDLYKLMESDHRFEPVVVVCPYMKDDPENMFFVMDQAYNTFHAKQFNVIKAYNEETNTWLGVKKEIQPDIVFFTNPHRITKAEYYITNYLNCLTCYVPYNFGNSHLFQMMHNQIFHNVLWRLFAETNIHRDYSVKYADNKGINVFVTGFPGTDLLLNRNYIPTNIWKQKDKKIKKIIWAPHHSIDNDISFLSYSSFLRYADYMLNIIDEYQGKIQIAFKPHPLLKKKLYDEASWGKEKTDNYYNSWNNMLNGQLVEGDYIDLFLSSDAMIHDSGSFLIEYIYTGKPVLHTNRDENLRDRMNAFGVLAFNLHYHAKNEKDIKAFIENLLNNKDEKKQERAAFLTSKLLPPNHKSASQNIYDEIVKQLS
jgi:hypothetical protein